MFTLISDNKFKCDVCSTELTYDSKQGQKVFTRNFQSLKHKNALEAKSKQVMLSSEEFNEKLIKWMIRCNISFALLEKNVFTNFIAEISGKRPCGRVTGSINMLQDIHTYENAKLIIALKGKSFYVMVDETPDVKGRKIVNVLIGILNSKKYIKSTPENRAPFEQENWGFSKKKSPI